MNRILNIEQKKLTRIFKILSFVFIILFLLSFFILIARIGHLIPENKDLFFIEPISPKLVIADDDKIWSGNTEINIFNIENINDEGIITIQSGTGDNIIAPGSKGTYKFSFKNLGNVAIDYNLKIKAYFIGKGINDLEYEIPFKIRLIDYKNDYIIGSNNEYTNVGEIYKDTKTVGVDSYVYYNFEWMWPFESNNDEFDTLLGNMSTNNKIQLKVKIDIDATQSKDINAKGGIKCDNNNTKLGGTINIIPYIILNLIIFLIALIILYIRQIRNTRIF